MSAWKSVKWLKFMERVARRMQIDPSSAAFNDVFKGMVAEFANDRLREVWYCAAWPVLMTVEERTWPDADDKYIPWREAGQNEIPEDGVDARFCMYAAKPLVSEPGTGLGCEFSARGIEATDDLAPDTTCWVRYLAACPKFTAEAHVSGQAYGAGDVVYFADTGECYESLVDDNDAAPEADGVVSDDWELQAFPDLLADAVLRYVLADLFGENGEYEAAGRQESRADGFLLDLQERVFGNVGSRATVQVS